MWCCEPPKVQTRRDSLSSYGLGPCSFLKHPFSPDDLGVFVECPFPFRSIVGDVLLSLPPVNRLDRNIGDPGGFVSMDAVGGEQALKARHLDERLVELMGEVVNSAGEDVNEHGRPRRRIRWELWGRGGMCVIA